MNLIELRKHIDDIRWDDDFMPFCDNASLGMPDDVFDLVILRYLDHDCKSTYIDFELLKYCAERQHELAKNLIALSNRDRDLENCNKNKILLYYKSKSPKDNLRQLWLLGYCYETFGLDYSISKETENAYGPYCMVKAFEYFKKCADSNFPIGVKYAVYYCDNPQGYNIAIKNNETLLQKYRQKIIELHLDI